MRGFFGVKSLFPAETPILGIQVFRDPLFQGQEGPETSECSLGKGMLFVVLILISAGCQTFLVGDLTAMDV